MPTQRTLIERGELSEWGHREALRQAEEEAREVHALVTRYEREGLGVRVVLYPGDRWLRLEAIPATRRP